MTARALLIEVRWPDGRFHGVRETRRGERGAVAPEWPPSPFRLFQALVAGAYGGRWASEAVEDKDAAFAWLERQAAPAILAPTAERLKPVRYYVPNNDMDSPKGERALKTLRTSAFNPDQPVAYLWRFEGEAEPAHRMAELAERLHTLGHGLDAAFAQAGVLDAEAGEARLVALGGAPLRPGPGAPQPGETPTPCPAVGSLDSLRRRHAAFTQRFERVGAGRRAQALFRQPPKPHARAVVYARPAQRFLFELRPAQGPTPFAPWPLEQAYGLAVAVRDLLAARLGKTEARVERFVTGRTAGPADTARRVRILPLPSIGAAYTDPRIRRVLVELPPDCPISALELGWALAGQGLVTAEPDTGEITSERLLVPATDRTMLRHYGVEAPAARLWSTVTPAVLPEAAARRRIDPERLALHVPGEAKAGVERAAEEARAASAVLQALRHAGVTAPVTGVRVQREPFAARRERAEPFAAGTRFLKERLWHVQVAFAEPVAGPLAIGDGRFCGLGILSPAHDARPCDLFGFEVTSDRPVSVADRPALLQAIRRALMARARDTAALSLFSGHAPDSAPARSGQHRHAYLAVTGENAPVLWVVAPWRVDRSWTPKSSDRRDFARAVEGVSTVRAGRLGLLQLQPVRDDLDLLNRPARTWESATPYRLDRHPRRGQAFAAAAIADVQAACLRLGLPRPEVELIGAAEGGAVRARLDFGRSVAGPLLLGRDAHVGGGLFLPRLTLQGASEARSAG